MTRVRCIRAYVNEDEVIGSVDWDEYEAAHAIFIGRNRRRRTFRLLSAERLAEMGGFGYAGMTELLGHEPHTWEPD